MKRTIAKKLDAARRRHEQRTAMPAAGTGAGLGAPPNFPAAATAAIERQKEQPHAPAATGNDEPRN